MLRAIVVTALLCIVCVPVPAKAQSAAELESQIKERNNQIRLLEEEIVQYQKQVDALGKQRSTLQTAIDSLSISQKQLSARISVTENKIEATNLELRGLESDIVDTEKTIERSASAVAEAFRQAAQEGNKPFVTQVFAANSLAEAWQAIDALGQFNTSLKEHINELAAAKTLLAANHEATELAKATLVQLKSDLTLEKKSIDASKAAQQTLLTETKSQESSYQKLIAQKQAAERAFEQELISLQGQLDLIVNPGLLPKVGSGVLNWPLSATFMQSCATRKKVFGNIFCITQFFGNTPFATKNPQIYNGAGHNAIDFGTPVGTPIRAALSGTVLGVGNTDTVRGCYSFGKWVMLKHNNGLNTLYAHLSSAQVSEGQSVAIGQVIGLAGMTGYATGPHLHFAVYASQGTTITTLASARGATKSPCSGAVMPIATKDAYLNPLSYL